MRELRSTALRRQLFRGQRSKPQQAGGAAGLSSNPRDFGLSFITIRDSRRWGTNSTTSTSVHEHISGPGQRPYARANNCEIRFRLPRFAGRSISRCSISRFPDFLRSECRSPTTRFRHVALVCRRYGGARLDNHQHLRTESYNFTFTTTIALSDA